MRQRCIPHNSLVVAMILGANLNAEHQDLFLPAANAQQTHWLEILAPAG